MRLIERLGLAWKLLADSGGVTSQVPWDDFWYASNHGYQTATGLRVSPESALRVAAVFACVRVVAETVASLPLIVYRRLPNGGKTRATEHPLYSVLHEKPNQWQTAYEWLEMMQGHLELRGNAFSVIVPGPKGAIQELVPIHPDRVNVYRLNNGRLQYKVTSQYNATPEIYTQEEMFHLRGLSADGLVGMSTVAVGAETIACGLAGQEFAGRFFQNGATPSGVFTAPKGLNEEQWNRYQKSIREAHSGDNAHKVMVLEEGMTWTAIGVTNKDSQLLEARQFSRSDIASMWRVPPHKIGDLSRSSFSNIEQQNIEFSTDCIRPRLVRFERRIHCDLIEPLDTGDGNEYFCEFLMDALLRGDITSRYRSYAVARQWGWLSVNDVRAMENLNPLDEGGDEYLRPLNMVDATSADPDAMDENIAEQDSTATGSARLPAKRAQKQLTSGEKIATARLREFAQNNAERVVRKEVKALTKAMEKRDGNGAVLEAVEEFYSTHGAFVSESMCISHTLANVYVKRNRSMFFTSDSTVALAEIESYAADFLADLALDEKEHTPTERPIHITMPAQTINLNPTLNVQPMEMKVNVNQTNLSATKNVTLIRDEKGRVNSFEMEAGKKQFNLTRDADGKIEKVGIGPERRIVNVLRDKTGRVEKVEVE